MPSEIAIPFHLDADKKIAVETDPNRQIRQHVMSLINTEPVERVVLTNYGIPLSRLLFEEGDEQVALELSDLLREGFARWEPGISLRSVNPEAGEDGDGIARVNVQYLRTDAPSTGVQGARTNVAIIRAGGKVTEVVRG
jgi:phage baseplate assembly protein W